MKVIKWMLLGAMFANSRHHPRQRRHRQSRLQRTHRRPHAGRHRRVQPVRGLHHPVPARADRRGRRESRGIRRLSWLGGALVSCMALVMTASRGGIVGVVFACAVGAYLYRHLISYSRVAGWVLGSLVVLVVVAEFLAVRRPAHRARLRADRATSTPPRPPRAAREIWANLFVHDVRSSRSRSSPASAGTCTGRCRSTSRRTITTSRCGSTSVSSACLTGCYLLFSAIARARRASLVAEQPAARPAHRLRASAAIAVSGAVFFVDLHKPWIYFWMYTGVGHAPGAVRRDAPAVVRRARTQRARCAPVPRDPYGWSRRNGTTDAHEISQDLHRRAGLVRHVVGRGRPASTSAARPCSTCCWRAPGAISATTSP